jgi:hypothetical protein
MSIVGQGRTWRDAARRVSFPLAQSNRVFRRRGLAEETKAKAYAATRLEGVNLGALGTFQGGLVTRLTVLQGEGAAGVV